jgi:ABC-type phosphate transport system substrate-binding protein
MDFKKAKITYCGLFLMGLQVAITTEAQTSLEVSASAKVIGTHETPAGRRQNKIVAITGVRFAYPLVQKWIDDYAKINPEVQIIIESRGTNDPTKYDILIEAYEPDAGTKTNRNYVYVARYAILSVANSSSAFSKQYADKGLNRDLIKQLFFYDIFLTKKDQVEVKVPYTVYTRLQKAGSPITFSNYFGFQQKDIKGKSIAGSDEHLLKAVLRDSTGLTYAPLSLAYYPKTGKPVQGLTILPVDLNGNGKVSDDEKFYENLSTVIQRLEEKSQKEINNVPIEYLNLSVKKNSPNPEAVLFLQWIVKNGQSDLHTFGFLKPEAEKRNEQP